MKAVIRRLNKDRQDIGRKKMDKQRSVKHYTLKYRVSNMKHD